MQSTPCSIEREVQNTQAYSKPTPCWALHLWALFRGRPGANQPPASQVKRDDSAMRLKERSGWYLFNWNAESLVLYSNLD